MSMFTTVLVANRGEIACRVMRTLRTLGITSVAVYSDADADARHVREADHAVRIGPPPAASSYLDIDAVIAAALASNAQAIHPGYGFLSENPDFARACEAAGIVFIGPPVSAITAMGDKIRAREHVAARGVPITPGFGAAGSTDDELIAAAAELGFPLIIKPSGGGGGKGMSVVTSADLLPEALRGARRVAASAFADDTLLLEKFISNPRHIEVQVLADQHGSVAHLAERECSLQRRHQKVIEEAPSALLDEQTRERIGVAACEVARSVDYVGAGTVEFLVSADRPDELFFMEMNTRLQVEHPVTELVTGVDLVEQQVRMAAGERLALPELTLTGHAVEARLYAEDPARGFLPETGTVLRVRDPEGAGVRVDSALHDGLVVGADYDPLLAKVIAHGDSREQAIDRLDAALADMVVLGVQTNAAFLRAILAVDAVRAGDIDTGLIERAVVAPEPSSFTARAIAAALEHARAAAGATVWRQPTGWRMGEHRAARYDVDGASVAVASAEDGVEVTIDGRTETMRVVDDAGDVTVHREGALTRSLVARTNDTTWVHVDGTTHRLRRRTRAELLAAHRAGLDRAQSTIDPHVRAVMPGTVVAVAAATGDSVVEGDPLVTIEAMKMEHAALASIAGTVTISVSVGDQVRQDQVVARIDPHEGDRHD
ncbi:MAG: ATP-grasp domain-containing protein [Microcella sp.]|uniref:acetyl/propionyl/methylcrotonyl-CoA carboxylase subunit alpha n=1 Tax=Microcella sp. TaxID=1913979 RepID=UPI0024CC89C4|nr:biotin carboxylase N-terminal domain-containing protein [Microcella sp.]UYN84669.1 MAG: ATP-grasp domain-containing protein [Microcella sp.]